MQNFQIIGTKFTRIGPVPFFIAGGLLLVLGAALQVTQIIALPDIAGGSTTFGLFAKLGGAVILFGLFALALHNDGSAEPGRDIPDEVPQSARRAAVDDAVRG